MVDGTGLENHCTAPNDACKLLENNGLALSLWGANPDCSKTVVICRRVGRVVDGTGLENRHTRKAYRGFESLTLRQLPNQSVWPNRGCRGIYGLRLWPERLHFAYRLASVLINRFRIGLDDTRT